MGVASRCSVPSNDKVADQRGDPETANPAPVWWRQWLTWSNALTLVVLVWAAPRCWPHVEALAGVRAREARQPRFAVTLRDGRPLSADALRGRVVFVNVWATWCPPCRAEMPALQQLADAYAADGVVVLGLSVDQRPADEVDQFLTERGIRYPNAIIDDAILREFGGVRGYPTSFLLDRAGIIRHTVMGPVGVVTLRPAIRRLLDEPSPNDRAITPRSP